MYRKPRHLKSCNAFIESRKAKIEELARLVLRKRNCTDADNHTPEVVNDVYVKVRQSWHSLHSPEYAIYSITKHTASTHAAKCRREAPAELDDDACPLFSAHPLDPCAMLERIILLKELMTMLKDKLDVEIFNLRLQGYLYEEMAVILEVDSATLRSRYIRAVRRLRPIVSNSVTPYIPETDYCS